MQYEKSFIFTIFSNFSNFIEIFFKNKTKNENEIIKLKDIFYSKIKIMFKIKNQ
jgi:hypothetical protein